MGTQARPEWDQRWYNINRDVAHNFKFVARQVAARLEDGSWPFLDQWLKDQSTTMDDLGEACKAFCVFVQSSTDNPKEGMEECLARSGWNAVKPPAQAALCAILGTVMMGIYFTGSREATFKENGVVTSGPCLTVQDLVEAGDRAATLCSMSRWRRALLRLRLRVKRIWAAVRGDDDGRKASQGSSGPDPRGLQVNAGGGPGGLAGPRPDGPGAIPRRRDPAPARPQEEGGGRPPQRPDTPPQNDDRASP